MPLCNTCTKIDIRSVMATAVENFNERGASSNWCQFPPDNCPHKYLDNILEAKANMNVCDFCAFV